LAGARVVMSVLLLFSGTASACPVCESETGREVRAGIFNELFWENVLLTLLPFPILLAVVALIYFDLSWLWKRQATPGKTAALNPQPLPGE
jgi:hypothetical protein